MKKCCYNGSQWGQKCPEEGECNNFDWTGEYGLNIQSVLGFPKYVQRYTPWPNSMSKAESQPKLLKKITFKWPQMARGGNKG